MFILTISGREDEGAYSVVNEDGDQVLYLFEEEDDYPEMHVMEIDDDLLVNVCEMHGHEYVIITPNDIMIPPKENDIV